MIASRAYFYGVGLVAIIIPLSLVKQIDPHYFSKITLPSTADCGHWQSNYVKFQEKMLKSSAPRMVYSGPLMTGLADRLSGIVTQFYFALLSNRAFQIVDGYDVPSLFWAYDSRILQLQGPRLEQLIGNNMASLPVHYPFPELDRTKYAVLDHVNSYNLVAAYFLSNLTLQPINHTNVQYVFYTSNRGYSYRLFENPFHRDQLKTMGLRPESSFRCIMDFLFRPNAQTLRYAQPLLESLEDGTALKISIQIRVGDNILRNRSLDNVTVNDFKPFFTCAEV